MAILLDHVRFHEEILHRPEFLASPTLVFGHQDIYRPTVPIGARAHLRKLAELRDRGPPPLSLPSWLGAAHFKEVLHGLGVDEVHELDLFDPRADLRYDMNQPVPEREHQRYATLIDIGCLEHVFDTATCLFNCMKMVRVGGYYSLHTNVNGFFRHGFHVFHPWLLVGALRMNGFEVQYRRFTTARGRVVTDPGVRDDIIIWIVARKLEHVERFQAPQQCARMYERI